MNEERIRVCWHCQKIYRFERKTSRYCSDICRVKDNNIRAEEIRIAIYKLELNQKAERAIRSHHILMDYKKQMGNK